MTTTISEKPWSDYTKADYTPEQWHAACLIHLHDGPPTSKDQCKLPVKTPTGTLNRAGVHAAAAALAGARGGVQASPEQKSKAAAALVRYYSQLKEDPPPSLTHEELSRLQNFLAHYGRKGMKWGRHIFTKESGGGGKSSGGEEKKSESSGGKEGEGTEHLSADAERMLKTSQKDFHSMSDREIKEANNRAEAIKKYDSLFNDPNRDLRAKVDALRLQKDYAQLRREMNPTALQRAQRFAKNANDAFEQFQKLDKATGGRLSGNMKSFFSTSSKTSGTSHRTTFTPKGSGRSSGGNFRRGTAAKPTWDPNKVHKITTLGP